jgi:hypothetical protein
MIHLCRRQGNRFYRPLYFALVVPSNAWMYTQGTNWYSECSTSNVISRLTSRRTNLATVTYFHIMLASSVQSPAKILLVQPKNSPTFLTLRDYINLKAFIFLCIRYTAYMVEQANDLNNVNNFLDGK